MIYLLITIVIFCLFIWALVAKGLINIELDFKKSESKPEVLYLDNGELTTEKPKPTIPKKPNKRNRKATPMDYHITFEVELLGEVIINDLVAKFGGSSYVRGGLDADRESCFRAGQKHVIDHILIQMSRAHQPETEQPEVQVDD